MDQRGLAFYGLWATLQALVNLASIAGFSMAPGLALSVQDSAPRHYLGWFRAASCLTTPCCTGILALGVLALIHLADGDIDVTQQVAFTLPLCAAMLFWAVGNDAAQLAAAVLRGSDHYGSSARISVFASTLQVIYLGALATLDVGLAALAAGAAAFACARAALLMAAIPRFAEAAEGVSLPSLSHRLRQLWDVARWQWLRSASAVAMATVDRLIVGHLLGPTALALYAVCVMVAEAIHRLFSAVLQPAMQWAGRRRRAGEDLRVAPRWFVLIQLAVIAVGVICAALAPLALPWLLGDDAAGAMRLLWIAIAAATLSAFQLLPVYLLTGGGRNHISARASLFGAAAALSAILLLAPHGSEAAMAGRLLYGLALFACWPALRRD